MRDEVQFVWNMTPYRFVNKHQRFGEACCLHCHNLYSLWGHQTPFLKMWQWFSRAYLSLIHYHTVQHLRKTTTSQFHWILASRTWKSSCARFEVSTAVLLSNQVFWQDLHDWSSWQTEWVNKMCYYTGAHPSDFLFSRNKPLKSAND